MSRDEQEKRARLRRAVESKLERKLPKEIWGYLDGNNSISEALNDDAHDDPVAWLVEEARKLLNLQEASVPHPLVIPPRRLRRLKVVPLRLEVISVFLAAEARKDRRVQLFRSEYLNSRLLDPVEVGNWIESRVQTATSQNAVVVRVSDSVNLGTDDGAFPPIIVTPDMIENIAPRIVLAYATPNTESIRQRPVGRDGVLRELAYLADTLAARFSWQPAQASTFVLTDYVPLLRSDRVTVRSPLFSHFGSDGMRELSCLYRFTLDVDPRKSAREVARLFAKAKERFVTRKLRNLAEKTMLLASFIAQHGELTQRVMALWNQLHPEWKYQRYSFFSRDARAARERLLFGPVVDRRTLPRGDKKA